VEVRRQNKARPLSKPSLQIPPWSHRHIQGAYPSMNPRASTGSRRHGGEHTDGNDQHTRNASVTQLGRFQFTQQLNATELDEVSIVTRERPL
jgi:hypothetical protein